MTEVTPKKSESGTTNERGMSFEDAIPDGDHRRKRRGVLQREFSAADHLL